MRLLSSFRSLELGLPHTARRASCLDVSIVVHEKNILLSQTRYSIELKEMRASLPHAGVWERCCAYDQTMLRSEKVNKTVALCAAARTGELEQLERASKSSLNRSDDEQITPAMWSAARGQLAALRVIVERGFVSVCSAVHHHIMNESCVCLSECLSVCHPLWRLLCCTVAVPES